MLISISITDTLASQPTIRRASTTTTLRRPRRTSTGPDSTARLVPSATRSAPRRHRHLLRHTVADTDGNDRHERRRHLARPGRALEGRWTPDKLVRPRLHAVRHGGNDRDHRSTGRRRVADEA